MKSSEVLPYFIAIAFLFSLTRSKSPDTPDNPTPSGPVKVLIIAESSEKYDQDRTNIFTSTKITSAVKEKGGEILILDPDQLQTVSNSSPNSKINTWKPLVDTRPNVLPSLQTSGGRKNYKGPLPSFKDTLSVIQAL